MVRLIAFLTLYLVFVNVTYPTTGGVTKLSSLNILESCNKIKTEIQNLSFVDILRATVGCFSVCTGKDSIVAEGKGGIIIVPHYSRLNSS